MKYRIVSVNHESGTVTEGFWLSNYELLKNSIIRRTRHILTKIEGKQKENWTHFIQRQDGSVAFWFNKRQLMALDA